MVDRQNNYLGGTFITNRIKERLLARVRGKRRPLPKGMEVKPEAIAGAWRYGDCAAPPRRGGFTPC